MNEQEIKAVDDHIDAVAAEPASVNDFSSMPAAQMLSVIGLAASLCAYYASAKPAIDFAVKFLLFWKPKWQTVIRNVEGGIENVCAAITPPAPPPTA